MSIASSRPYRPARQGKRDLAESGFQIDNHRGALAQASQLHGAIHRNGRRAGTALAPTKAIVVAWAASPTTRFRRDVTRRMASWNDLSEGGHAELVGARTHRLKDEVRIRFERHHDDGRARRRNPKPLYFRQRVVVLVATIDDNEIGVSSCRSRRTIPDADGNGARPQQVGRRLSESLVVTQNLSREKRHVQSIGLLDQLDSKGN